MSVWLKVLAVFIFHNRGWQDVWPVAELLLLLWLAMVFVYAAVLQPLAPPPKFFGVSWRRARWVHYSYSASDYVVQVLPWKWSGRRRR